ncbi:hypothetical protein RJT34_07879 [Clitoria ternatea]|uniref:Embryo defective 1273 n=1 Tax=Clitoria ternatea TaxID=43366 RepID=A0AAN9K5J3_CLITE
MSLSYPFHLLSATASAPYTLTIQPPSLRFKLNGKEDESVLPISIENVLPIALLLAALMLLASTNPHYLPHYLAQYFHCRTMPDYSLIEFECHQMLTRLTSFGYWVTTPLKSSLKVPLFFMWQSTSCFVEKHNCCLSVKPFCVSQKIGTKISCAMNMPAQQSDDHGKMKLGQLIAKAQKLWDSAPEPVKNFPWTKALDNFIQLILDLILVIVKYLSVPVFAITSLSELSYCAHERKLVLVPIPLLFGVAVAGILKETALELSPRLRDAEVPWHLIAIAIFFTLIKLPGPYYPYWGRIFIPHVANGVLWRTLWFAVLWCRRPKPLKMSDPVDDS